MQIDIAAHIEKLLFLHDTLTIPSFGGFTATRAPAAVDYAGGAVTPPSKTLTFNESLTFDDGILVDDIAKTHELTAADAQAAVQAFVDQIQQQLNQREIVTLPGVGRLYKNYVQKIQFLPDATNFHAGSYGLPPLQFSPIARSREIAEKPAAQATPNGTTASMPVPPTEPAKSTATPAIPPLPPPPPFVSEPYTAPRTSGAQFGTGIGIGLVVCALAFGIWYWQHKNAAKGTAPTTELQADDNQNPPVSTHVPGISEMAKLAEKEKTPATKPEPATPDREDEDLNDEVEQAAAAKKVEILRRQNEPPQSSVQAAKAENSRECILVIATLQDPTNAERLIAKLKGAGYDVYSVQQRGYQVGVRFDYANASDIDKMKAELIRFTGEKGIVVKKK